MRGSAAAILSVLALALGSQAEPFQERPSPAQRPLETWRPVPRADDPRADGWDSEVIGGQAESQLKRIGKLLLDPSKIDRAHVQPLTGSGFSCHDLRPDRLQRVFEDRGITVDRWAGPDEQNPAVDAFREAEGLVDALLDLSAPFARARDVRFEFKVFRVDLDLPLPLPLPKGAGDVTTRLFFSMSGHLEGGGLEQHATWQCRWTRAGAGTGGGAEPPRLQSIALLEYEQVRVHTPGSTLFADCTEAVLGHNACFKPQLLRGTFDWAGHIETVLGVDAGAFQGPAVGDVNGDGLEDVYICQAGGLPNRLFVQNLDATATDRSEWAGVDWSDLTRCALLIDLDNDGDQDLVLGARPGLIVMSNDGTGRFAQRTIVRLANRAYGLVAADYDLDGDLDLYVCRYHGAGIVLRNVPNPLPIHDANNGAANFLLRNDGEWRFTDVTRQTGMDADNRRWTLAATWDDYDNDGDPDLYVANDFGRNCLYRNDGGHFVNVARQAGVEDISSGMSACWGDYNRDGLMDMHVANMWSSAGGRIAYQSRFQPDFDRSTKALVQRLGRGNSLFANRGDGTFADVSVDTGITMGRWSWSSNFVDLNNDGWEDLVVANGFMTAPDTGDL